MSWVDIRRAIRQVSEPFDGRALLPKLNRNYSFREVQNVLHNLASKGELHSQYIKRGKRQNAVVFTTTSQFGGRESSTKRVSVAMNRLNEVVRNWYVERH